MLQGLLRGVTIAGAAGTTTDPFFSSVVLLMGFEGANGSTGAPGMTDESPLAHGTATVTADAQISTAQFKFGASSLLVDGTGDLITYVSNTDWDFGSGAFTVECWIRPANVTAGNRMIVGVWSNTTLAWILYQTSTTLAMNINASPGGNIAILFGTGGTVVAITQQAVCVDYDGATYRMYLNGVMVDSLATPHTIAAGTKPLSIGANSDAALAFNGNIDELRITKGVARYASDAGYTPATARFPRS